MMGVSCLVDKLIEAKQLENSSDLFTEMPSPYYMEVATLLLNKCVYVCMCVCVCVCV